MLLLTPPRDKTAKSRDRRSVFILNCASPRYIMDNLGSHKGKAVRKAVRAAGAKLTREIREVNEFKRF